MIIVTNEKNELVPTRTVISWHVCIDCRKLNEATRKDHFPLPFMDQMLEILAGNKFFCFLYGFSGYFHIPIEPADQEKITFTCLYGTYAYKCMPFGLCNALATFQRCMIAIFQDMLETLMEVFMDDFSVFINSFDASLGWHFEEIHVTWAHLEKRQTRLRLYTKSFEEIVHTERGYGVANYKRRRQRFDDGVRM
ncbi:reverse transcriptase domain-containing protein [Tanacetum coccineum]